uniref:Ovule protein n=1 Tax=Steinernema glaseri TaxID=37863 RepID=A0A1I7ZHX9_9BILA
MTNMILKYGRNTYRYKSSPFIIRKATIDVPPSRFSIWSHFGCSTGQIDCEPPNHVSGRRIFPFPQVSYFYVFVTFKKV